MFVAFELGGLAATTRAHDSWKDTSRLFDDAPPAEFDHTGWWHLRDLAGRAGERAGERAAERAMTAVPPAENGPSDPPRLLAFDVEMIERRSDGARLPVKAALIAHDLSPDGSALSVRRIFEGLVDPSSVDPSWATDESAWDYKTDIHGLSSAHLISQRAGATSLVDLQSIFQEEAPPYPTLPHPQVHLAPRPPERRLLLLPRARLGLAAGSGSLCGDAHRL